MKTTMTNSFMSPLLLGVFILLSSLVLSVAVYSGLKYQADRAATSSRESTCGAIFASDDATNKQKFQYDNGSCDVYYGDADNGAFSKTKRF